jgi:hypothetical protein
MSQSPPEDIRRVSGLNMLTLVKDLNADRNNDRSPYATLPSIEVCDIFI